jgi:ADP-heptose:LPS heptosyltransferase
MKRLSTNTPINLLINLDAIGDTVCTLPTLRYIFKNYPVPINVWCNLRMYDILKQVVPEENLFISEKEYLEVNRNYPTRIASETTNKINNSSGDLINHFSWTLMNMSLPENEKYYPRYDTSNIDISKFENEVDLEKAVFIIPTFLWMSKMLLGIEINKLIDYIIQKGYTPVLIGREKKQHHNHGYQYVNKPENIDIDKCVNFLNRDTIPQAAAMFNKAKAVIGVDSGLLHLASMTDTNIIAGYTVIDPEVQPRYRITNSDNIEKNWNYQVVTPECDCKYCGTNSRFVYNMNISKCVLDTYDCVRQMTAEKFIEKLENIL